jgi:AcrR family transcriptional regulator
MPMTPAPQRAPPRKLPKQARSVATVSVLVEAAARILEQHGHGGFSTNAVAERAGVSIGSLYQYFPRKDALIGALIARETAGLVADAEGAMAQPTGHAAFAVLIRACVAHQLRRPTLARLLDFEEARLPLDAEACRFKARFGEIVRDLLGRPDIPPQADGAAATHDVTAIIKGMVDAAGERGEADQARLAGRVERAVFGYLGAAA